nr:hypothetical protein BaRGS_025992 [Batillaria attramentaria]
MDATTVVWYWLLLVFVATAVVRSDDGEEDVKECAGNHVCTTLMRYPDGYTADEGPNCHWLPECRPGLLTTAPTRNSDRLPCSKIYIDPYKSSDKVLEVSFLCACPEGQMCPGRLHKKTEDGDLETESDEQGTFVYKYCENTKLSRQTA